MKPPSQSALYRAASILLDSIIKENGIVSALEFGDDILRPDPNTSTQSELLRNAEALRQVSDSLELMFQPTIASLNHSYNSRLPIGQLPIEILEGILLLSIDNAHEHYERLSHLSRVSKQWRDVTLFSPRFHAIINDRHSLSANKKHLEYSGAAPLHLVCRDNGSDESFVDLIRPESRRWASIVFTGDGAQYPFVDLPTPKLADLHLIGTRGAFVKNDGVASIRHLWLERCAGFLPLELSSAPFARLETLRLEGEVGPSWKVLIKFLSSSRLTSLHLDYSNTHPPPSGPDEIFIDMRPVTTQLSHLNIVQAPTQEIKDLISHIEAPNCKVALGCLKNRKAVSAIVLDEETVQRGLLAGLLASTDRVVIHYRDDSRRIALFRRSSPDSTSAGYQLLDAYVSCDDATLESGILHSASTHRLDLRLYETFRLPQDAKILSNPNIAYIHVRCGCRWKPVMDALGDYQHERGWRCPKLQNLEFTHLSTSTELSHCDWNQVPNDLVDFVQKRRGGGEVPPSPDVTSVTVNVVFLTGVSSSVWQKMKDGVESANKHVPAKIHEWSPEEMAAYDGRV